MPKNIQIPYELFLDLLLFHLTDEPDEDGELERAIQDALLLKRDAIIRHNLYTAYKTAETPEQREAARQQYLDAAGILPGWRWKEGYDPNRE